MNASINDAVITPDAATAKPVQHPSTKNWPSYLYLSLLILNSLVLAYGSTLTQWSNLWLLAPLIIVQGLFFMGLLELLHQAVHHNFITHRTINEIIGTIAAALIGINLVAYRYFHLAHHRHTCDEKDPEGLLYAQSPSTRWMALGSPIEHAYVALQINRLASRYVPVRKRAEWNRARVVLFSVLAIVSVLAFLAPVQFVAIYFLPVCLFAWIDFFFSQAEHYDAPVRPLKTKPDAEDINKIRKVSFDIVLPTALSHLMLNRNLHAVHHIWPRTRWFEAPVKAAELQNLADGRTLSFGAFLKLWFKGGPRQWR